MKLKALLSGLEPVKVNADVNLEISDIAYDSRKVTPGAVFVAISGFETDGHKYIDSAIDAGAVCVICENAPETDIPYVQCDNCRAALAQISANFFRRPADELVMIGVTGTNGKTTITHLIKQQLEKTLNKKVGLIGTNGNMIGDKELHAERTTPESYELQKILREMADDGCEYVVMEVSSHALVLERIRGIHFKIGIFSNLTQDHLDFHRDMEDYASAKAKLFSISDIGIINLDDQWSKYILERAKCKVITFSEKYNEADVVAKDIRLTPSSVRFAVMAGGQLERVTLGIPGMFSVYNALAVVACGMALGIDLGRTAEALSVSKPVKGRVEAVPTDGEYTILIDYAHTPDALENVLKSMKYVAKGRVVVVFGCGGDRDRSKRPKMGKIAAENADMVIVTSDNPRTEEPTEIISQITEGLKGSNTPKKIITDRIEAINWAIENHQPGDVIILAGKGHEDYQIVGKEKHHMDEREIVREILEKRKKENDI